MYSIPYVAIERTASARRHSAIRRRFSKPSHGNSFRKRLPKILRALGPAREKHARRTRCARREILLNLAQHLPPATLRIAQAAALAAHNKPNRVPVPKPGSNFMRLHNWNRSSDEPAR